MRVLRRDIAPQDDITAIQLLGQPLQNKSGTFLAMINLPESGRSAAIDPIVAVVEGQDAQPRTLENGSPENAGSTTQEQVESTK